MFNGKTGLQLTDTSGASIELERLARVNLEGFLTLIQENFVVY